MVLNSTLCLFSVLEALCELSNKHIGVSPLHPTEFILQHLIWRRFYSSNQCLRNFQDNIFLNHLKWTIKKLYWIEVQVLSTTTYSRIHIRVPRLAQTSYNPLDILFSCISNRPVPSWCKDVILLQHIAKNTRNRPDVNWKKLLLDKGCGF